MRPLQEVQDIGQLRPLRNEEDSNVHLNNGNYNGWRPKTSRIWRLWRIPRFVWPRKATLMELGWLWKLSIPEIKVYRRKTETRSMRTRSFVKKTLKAGDINYGMIAHGRDMGINTAIHDVIARLWYCYRVELSMHFVRRIGWQKG